jgi:hypothetical protein
LNSYEKCKYPLGSSVRLCKKEFWGDIVCFFAAFPC